MAIKLHTIGQIEHGVYPYENSEYQNVKVLVLFSIKKSERRYKTWLFLVNILILMESRPKILD
ncbi:hypothetical protein [Anaerobutyricum hallii]|uniref:hypothetical protein n=1 Tax=Anaerobutyricum hallii TaxID=39488 RepID=UPI00399C5A60